MYRQSPSRNQRSKGIKTKHVLQICLLLAVCFWLIYQVKRSHDKKKEFDENDGNISLKMQSADEILRFGRKDLDLRVEKKATKNEKHEDEEVEEEETGGEEDKHEEEEQEEEKEDEGRGGGDDEIDEHDQEKSDMEVDREEDFIDEEKEREEDDEKESEEKDAEDKDGQIGNENSLEDHDGGGKNTREAREEHYKADDASSAVTHDTQTISIETEKGSLGNSNENNEMSILEQENKVNNTEEINVGQNTTGLKVGNSEMAGIGIPLNATADEEKGLETVSSKSKDNSVLNSTITTEANNQPEVSNNSTDLSTETHGLSLQNGTEIISDSVQAQNATVGDATSGEGSSLQTIVLDQANTSNIASNNNQSDSNSTITINTENAEATMVESSNSSTNLESVVSENVKRSNASAEAEESSGSSTTDENIDAIQNEKSETSNEMNGTNESSDSSKTEHSSIPLDEKEVRTDLDTLPEIRTEGSNDEDVAAE